jgi:hypothetical protein
MIQRLARAKKRSRVWITLLGDSALVELASRTDANPDDLRAMLDEMKKRVAKLESAAKGLEARLQKA